MDATVAVALITSLSTLTAAAVAGAVSVSVTRRQLQHQEAIARDDRAEQRAAEHREVRRQTYERYLSQVDAAYRLLDEGWKEPAGAGARWRDDAFTARRTLVEAYFRVELVGPEPVQDQAKVVLDSVLEEFALHKSLARSLDDETTAAAGPAAHRSAIEARQATTERFITAARTAVGTGREETAAATAD